MIIPSRLQALNETLETTLKELQVADDSIFEFSSLSKQELNKELFNLQKGVFAQITKNWEDQCFKQASQTF